MKLCCVRWVATGQCAFVSPGCRNSPLLFQRKKIGTIMKRGLTGATSAVEGFVEKIVGCSGIEFATRQNFRKIQSLSRVEAARVPKCGHKG